MAVLTDHVTATVAAPTATVESKPTPKLGPTMTPAPTPTRTLAPTVTPVPTQRGLGVSRRDVASVFESVGFVFENAPLRDGTPRVISQAPDGESLMELIGPPGNLTKATLAFGVPGASSGTLSPTSVYIAAFLQQLAPNWNSGAQWVADRMVFLFKSGMEKAETFTGPATVKLTYNEELTLFLLQIAAR